MSDRAIVMILQVRVVNVDGTALAQVNLFFDVLKGGARIVIMINVHLGPRSRWDDHRVEAESQTLSKALLLSSGAALKVSFELGAGGVGDFLPTTVHFLFFI